MTDHPATLPPDAPLFTDEWRSRTLVRPGGDLGGMLRGLVAEQGVTSVLVEAGGRLAAALFAAGLVDEVVVYVAPLVCGGPVAAVAGLDLAASLRLGPFEVMACGEDVRLRARVLGPA